MKSKNIACSVRDFSLIKINIMNTIETKDKPRSFRVLKTAQCITIPIGGLFCAIIFLHALVMFADDGDGAEINAVMAFYRIIVSLVGFGLLFLQALGLLKMFKLNPSFLFWTRLYGFVSIGSKVILFVIGLITAGIIKSMANSDLQKHDIFTQAFAGDAYRAEVDKVVYSMIFGFVLYFIIAAMYPLFVLLLSYRKSLVGYVEKLKKGECG